jgi:hypothetical protein
MKASYFGFVCWWRFHTLTLYFDEGLAIFCFFLWNMKASHLTSYFDEGFFGFKFWWRLHTLTSYFNEGFIFSLKKECFTPNFVFWQRFLWLRILTKASHFDFIFRWRFSYFFIFFSKKRLHNWLHVLMKVSLASYFDDFIIQRRIHTLTSYFDEGLIFSLKMKASHLTSHFDEGFIFSLKNEGFIHNFNFLWRFLWLRILMKALHFDFIFRWRFCFSLKNEGFTPNFVFWRKFVSLRILMKASHFDFIFRRRFSYFFVFLWKWRFHTWLRILMKVMFFL